MNVTLFRKSALIPSSSNKMLDFSLAIPLSVCRVLFIISKYSNVALVKSDMNFKEELFLKIKILLY